MSGSLFLVTQKARLQHHHIQGSGKKAEGCQRTLDNETWCFDIYNTDIDPLKNELWEN